MASLRFSTSAGIADSSSAAAGLTVLDCSEAVAMAVPAMVSVSFARCSIAMTSSTLVQLKGQCAAEPM